MKHLDLFKIDETSSVPKYRQLINYLIEGIENGTFKKGDKIPSLNKIGILNKMSRDTVLMAFNELKTRGVITSIPGKGYFILTCQVEISQRIFVLFDELNSFKEDIYNSFLQHVEEYTDVDIYFHHFNFKIFSDLIKNAAGNYTSYIIMPATFDNTADIISILPSNKVYILDRLKNDLSGYPAIYQDFKQDLFEALSKNEDSINKYSHFVLINPGGKEPYERVEGFVEFCNSTRRSFTITDRIKANLIIGGTCFLVISDRDLVELIKNATLKSLKLGKDIGIISFNETMLKEVVAGGISTISTNFLQMGITLAQMIKSKNKESVRNPWMFIKRFSI
jgi:DNA-binding transcriptional regulator YhcF (GntR family)